MGQSIRDSSQRVTESSLGQKLRDSMSIELGSKGYQDQAMKGDKCPHTIIVLLD